MSRQPDLKFICCSLPPLTPPTDPIPAITSTSLVSPSFIMLVSSSCEFSGELFLLSGETLFTCLRERFVLSFPSFSLLSKCLFLSSFYTSYPDKFFLSFALSSPLTRSPPSLFLLFTLSTFCLLFSLSCLSSFSFSFLTSFALKFFFFSLSAPPFMSPVQILNIA